MTSAQAGGDGKRNLVLVLGDQLDRRSAAFDGFDRDADAVLMMEVEEEATWVPQPAPGSRRAGVPVHHPLLGFSGA